MLEISNVEAGLQTVGWLPKGLDAALVAKAAEDQGVEVVPLRSIRMGSECGKWIDVGFRRIQRTRDS
jgi:DNA-binding transcriptional MocR family regulator